MTAVEFLERKGIKNPTTNLSKFYNLRVHELIEFLEEYKEENAKYWKREVAKLMAQSIKPQYNKN